MAATAGSKTISPRSIEAAADIGPPSRTAFGMFENINVLRAFAAISVVVYHVIEHGHWIDFPIHGPLLTFRIGWMGVDLFFVISGFVISYSALVLYRSNPSRFMQDYWRRRLTRILPLYLLTLILWIAIFSNGFFLQPAKAWMWQLFTHVSFTHSFFIETHSAIDGVNWTLAIEMQFYLLVSLLIAWIDRTPGWRIWLYGIAIACAWRAAMFIRYGEIDSFVTFMRVTQLPGALDEFAAGIFLAKRVIDGRESKHTQTVLWLSFASLAGYAAMSIYWRNASYWNVPAMVVLWRVLLSLFLLCVVALAVRLPQTLGTVWLRPLSYLGEISYGIYLWHLFAIQFFVHMIGLRGLLALCAVLAATLVASAISWHFFERPFMSFARRKPNRTRTWS
jgi:peptidoglycan/LPS O-acetylase OafA/YrhL